MNQRYIAAVHRIQTAIAFLMGTSGYRAHEPKHLRVGIDTSKAEQGGLAELLIAKGVFTTDEYQQAMTGAAEKEADRLEAELGEVYGTKVRTI